VLGEHLASKAKNGPKKMEVTADGDDLETVFPCGFSKSLRYGACLELNKVRPLCMVAWLSLLNHLPAASEPMHWLEHISLLHHGHDMLCRQVTCFTASLSQGVCSE